ALDLAGKSAVIGGLEPDQEFALGLAEVLDRDLAELERPQRAPYRVGVAVAADPHLHQAAAGEIDAVVQADKDQQQNGRDIDRGRSRDEEISLADKVKIDIGTDEL